MLHNDYLDISARKLALLLKRPRETVRSHLHELNARFRAVQWLPHRLTQAQKLAQVDAAKKPLDHLKNKRNWPKTYTGDESWFSYENPGRGKWVFPREPALLAVRASLTPKAPPDCVLFELWLQGRRDPVQWRHS